MLLYIQREARAPAVRACAAAPAPEIPEEDETHKLIERLIFMKKIIAKVPEGTVPYKCGERLMACEVTEEFEFVRAAEFFKTKEEAKLYTEIHPEYEYDKRTQSNK